MLLFSTFFIPNTNYLMPIFNTYITYGYIFLNLSIILAEKLSPCNSNQKQVLIYSQFKWNFIGFIDIYWVSITPVQIFKALCCFLSNSSIGLIAAPYNTTIMHRSSNETSIDSQQSLFRPYA